MVNVWRLLIIALLATLPFALYNFWFRHGEWTKEQKYFRTFALLTLESSILISDTVGLQLPSLLERGILGFAIVSLLLWVYFLVEAQRNQPA